jgi:hypothetical protein
VGEMRRPRSIASSLAFALLALPVTFAFFVATSAWAQHKDDDKKPPGPGPSASASSPPPPASTPASSAPAPTVLPSALPPAPSSSAPPVNPPNTPTDHSSKPAVESAQVNAGGKEGSSQAAFVPREPPDAPPPVSHFKLPRIEVIRPIILPDGLVVPHVDVSLISTSRKSPQAGSVAAGIDLGFRDVAEFDVRFSAGFSGYHQLVGMFGFRAFGTTAAEIRINAGLGGWLDMHGDSTARFAMQPAVNAPMWFRLGHIARIETGIGMWGHLPVDHESSFFSFSTFSPDATLLEPGVPFRFLFQPFEIVYVGAGTGFGIARVDGSMKGRDVVDQIFVPLDFRAGGTVSRGGHPIADLEAVASFPYALGGDDPKHFNGDAFRLGFSARVFIQP